MTTFRATIQTQSGIDLTEMPFKSYQDKISHKNSYEDSQKLGSDMRASNIEAFVFTSARDQLAGKNVAAFTSKAFKTKDDRYVTMMQNWRCIANQNIIEFTRDEITHREFHEFAKDEFPELGLSN